MSQPRPDQNGHSADHGADRVGPRPLHRPQVDPAAREVFGRPDGVAGAFAGPQQGAPARTGVRPQPVNRPPEALAEAFGSPDGAGGLQRPPGPAVAEDDEPAPFWDPDAESDPWRDPGAGAMLAAPALTADGDSAGPRTPATRLSVTQVLFGRHVARSALVTLAVLALVLGATGGLVGWLIGRSGTALTDGTATLSQVDNTVQRAPGSIADVARNVAPTVVSLEVTVGTGGEQGSGVVISGEGYVLTNNHVVAEAADNKQAKITAVFTDGTRTQAQIVGRDPKTDIAVVKVNVSNPKAIQLGRSADLAVGDSVIAFGSPLGLRSTVTRGIVSALHRPVVAAGDNGEPPVTYDAIQTDAAINHGNSGGALVNAAGALVGINASIRSGGSDPNGGSIGIGFAIPVDQASQIAQGLIRQGFVHHPTLGVNVRSVSAISSQGAQIANVTPGGSAAAAGLREGDVVTRFGDRRIDTSDQLQVAVLDAQIGQQIPVQIVRGGATQTIMVTLKSD